MNNLYCAAVRSGFKIAIGRNLLHQVCQIKFLSLARLDTAVR